MTTQFTKQEMDLILEKLSRRRNTALVPVDKGELLSIDEAVEIGTEAEFEEEDVRECAMEVYEERSKRIGPLRAAYFSLKVGVKSAAATARWFVRNNTFHLFDCEGYNPSLDAENNNDEDVAFSAMVTAVADAAVAATSCYMLNEDPATLGVISGIAAVYGAVASLGGNHVGKQLRKVRRDYVEDVKDGS